MRARRAGLTAGWLVLATGAQVAAFIVLWRIAVRTERGQLLDTIALNGNSIGYERIDSLVGGVLDAMSVLSLAAATAVIGFIALIRGRFLLAVVTTVLIAGANLTTQVLKHTLARPDFGADPERDGIGNSLPSGHTTVAASVAVALVLVLPGRVRGWGALIAAGYAALAGVATLSAGWHRPSDAAAAMLIVGGWAGVAGLVLLLAQRDGTRVENREANWGATIVLAVTGLTLLGGAALAFWWTDGVVTIPSDELSWGRLFIAYAGGAVGIAGAAGTMMALVLATAHQVVPRDTRAPAPAPLRRVRSSQ